MRWLALLLLIPLAGCATGRAATRRPPPAPPVPFIPAIPTTPTASAWTPRRAQLPPSPGEPPPVAREVPEEPRQLTPLEAADQARAREQWEAWARYESQVQTTKAGVALLPGWGWGSDRYFTAIDGVIENRSGRTLRYVQITFVLLDASGRQVGTAFDNTNDLAAGRQWRFHAISFDRNSGAVYAQPTSAAAL